MRTVQDDISREDDAAPVDMLASLFEARGWTYEFVGEDEITVEVKGSWATYQLQAIPLAARGSCAAIAVPARDPHGR